MEPSRASPATKVSHLSWVAVCFMYCIWPRNLFYFVFIHMYVYIYLHILHMYIIYIYTHTCLSQNHIYKTGPCRGAVCFGQNYKYIHICIHILSRHRDMYPNWAARAFYSYLDLRVPELQTLRRCRLSSVSLPQRSLQSGIADTSQQPEGCKYKINT